MGEVELAGDFWEVEEAVRGVDVSWFDDGVEAFEGEGFAIVGGEFDYGFALFIEECGGGGVVGYEVLVLDVDAAVDWDELVPVID